MLPQPFALTTDMDLADAVKAAIHRHYPVYPVVDARPACHWRGARLAPVRAAGDRDQRAIGPDGRCGQGRAPVHGDLGGLQDASSLVAGEPVDRFPGGRRGRLFEGTITQIVALAAFLPILAGQTGNTGCQALAITLRGMTLGDMEQLSRAQIDRQGAGFWGR